MVTVWYLTRGNWVTDPDEPLPCVRCGRSPTPEGHDACLGYLPGVESACCGHGITEGRIAYKDGHIEEEEAG